MEQAIVDILENDAVVNAIISKRIYPERMPQGKVYPAITYTRINTDPTDEKDGVSKLDTIQVDLDLWGVDFKILKDLAKKVRTALDRFSGTKQSQVIDSIIFANQNSFFEDEADMFHISQSYTIRQKL